MFFLAEWTGRRHLESGAAKRNKYPRKVPKEKRKNMTEYLTHPSTFSPLVQPEVPAVVETSASSSSGLSMMENEQNVEKNRHCFKASCSRMSYDYTDWWHQLMAWGYAERFNWSLCVKGLDDLQHNDAKSLDAKRVIQKVCRNCTPAMFERRNRNEEVVIRSWLCFHQQMLTSTASFAS